MFVCDCYSDGNALSKLLVKYTDDDYSTSLFGN